MTKRCGMDHLSAKDTISQLVSKPEGALNILQAFHLFFYHVLTKNFVDFPSSIWEQLFNVTTTGLDKMSSFFSHAKEYKWVCWANYSLLQEQSYPLLSQEWPRHNLSLLYQYKLSWLVMRINKNINQGMFYDLTFNSWN